MVQAIYLGKTTDQFTQGTAYPIQGYADSIVVLLDDKNLLVSVAYASINYPKAWELKGQ